jgi:choline dehydrogenase
MYGETPRPEPEGEYDYIVVGSGAGGGPVAAGLARAGFTVAVLEAGGADTTCDYEVPAFFPKVSEDPLLRWDFIVRHYEDKAQQRRDPKLVDKEGEFGIWYPRSGTLGGCSTHNALITICPHASDWDDIAELTGDMSWKASEMRKYFARLERCSYMREPNFGRPHPGGHGFKGWLYTTAAPPLLLIADYKIFRIVLATLWSAVEGKLGPSLLFLWQAWRKFRGGGPIDFLKSFFDPNDTRTPCTEREGVFLVPFATASGRRISVRNLIDVTVQDHPLNLRVYTHSLVTRVLFAPPADGSSDGPTATGVEFVQGLNLYRADPNAARHAGMPPRRWLRARREVILAAGSFNTPQLLMLSGVGPRAELEEHGIEVLADRPGVGANMQDRYEVSVVSKTKSDFALTRGSTFRHPGIGEYPDPLFSKWLKGRGPYATNGVVVGFTKKSDPRRSTTDLFIFCVPGVFKGYFPGYTSDIARNKSHFSWVILKSHTTNRAGKVTLRSGDPRDVPDISFRYFSEGSDAGEADLEALVDGVEAVRHINAKLSGFVEKEMVPGADASDREALRTFVRNEAWGHHASCTAAMGRPDDPFAVVDSRFRVIGTKRLRVADASVFPKIPGFFIATSIYMIAEKAAEAILMDADALVSAEAERPPV